MYRSVLNMYRSVLGMYLSIIVNHQNWCIIPFYFHLVACYTLHIFHDMVTYFEEVGHDFNQRTLLRQYLYPRSLMGILYYMLLLRIILLLLLLGNLILLLLICIGLALALNFFIFVIIVIIVIVAAVRIGSLHFRCHAD